MDNSHFLGYILNEEKAIRSINETCLTPNLRAVLASDQEILPDKSGKENHRTVFVHLRSILGDRDINQSRVKSRARIYTELYENGNIFHHSAQRPN